MKFKAKPWKVENSWIITLPKEKLDNLKQNPLKTIFKIKIDTLEFKKQPWKINSSTVITIPETHYKHENINLNQEFQVQAHPIKEVKE